MKIQKIDNCQILNTKHQKQKAKSIAKTDCFDIISFKSKGNSPKGNGLGGLKLKIIRKYFPEIACYIPREDRTNLSPEEKKSEEIKDFISDTISSYDFVNKRGKDTYKELSLFLAEGKKQDYKGTIVYNAADNVNVSFSSINPDTKIPSKAIVWKDGGYFYSYNIEETEPKLKYTIEVPDGQITTTHSAVGVNINSFTQIDSKNSKVKQMDITENGFNYLFGKTFKDTQDVEIIKRLYFDFKDINGCIYAEGTEEGIKLYMYDHEKDLWEQRYLLELDEENPE